MASRYRGYDDSGFGPVTVTAAPWRGDASGCGHKEPFRVRATKGRKVIWAPKAPLCYMPSHDERGRRESPAKVAFDFFAAWSERTRGGTRPDSED